jgi:hypothetical protein
MLRRRRNASLDTVSKKHRKQQELVHYGFNVYDHDFAGLNLTPRCQHLISVFLPMAAR